MWETRVVSRARINNPSGCPKCNPRGRPATSNLQEWCAENGRADLLEEWAPPGKAPQDVSRASASKVPWNCGECGHAWEATIASRTDVKHPCGCPKCNPPREAGHQQPTGVVRRERAGGPASRVGAPRQGAAGRGLHSFTFQLKLGRV
jgi:hypothetical protein